ncbi:MAG: hypothetical protein KA713_06140 [Chryseotalea sp. WA131a]|nr:MAG: hypothetical protein KA713_06140 [Chryseotalea sp. WA131a]
MDRMVLVFIIVMLLGCSNSRSVPKSNGASIDTEVQKKLGNRFESIESPTKKYTLYYQKRDPQDHMNREFRFLVLENASKKWVHEGSFVQGYIKWTSESELEFTVKSKNINTEPSITKVNVAAINKNL